MPSDFRVPLAPCLDAFGVAAIVTRPAPDDEPIPTTVIWAGPMPVETPGGSEWQRQEPKRVLTVPLSEVATVPVGTRIVAPEVLGGPTKAWQVDALVGLDSDEALVIVVEIEV